MLRARPFSFLFYYSFWPRIIFVFGLSWKVVKDRKVLKHMRSLNGLFGLFLVFGSCLCNIRSEVDFECFGASRTFYKGPVFPALVTFLVPDFLSSVKRQLSSSNQHIFSPAAFAGGRRLFVTSKRSHPTLSLLAGQSGASKKKLNRSMSEGPGYQSRSLTRLKTSVGPSRLMMSSCQIFWTLTQRKSQKNLCTRVKAVVLHLLLFLSSSFSTYVVVLLSGIYSFHREICVLCIILFSNCQGFHLQPTTRSTFHSTLNFAPEALATASCTSWLKSDKMS